MLKRWKTWVGVLISAVAIWYAARGVDWGEVGTALAEADYLLLGAVFVLAPVVNIGMRALRWRILLLPAGRLPMSSLLSATAIGLLANNVLPARIGEFVRAWALARRTHVPTGTAFGSLFVERMFDGFALVGILYTLTFLHEFQGWVDTTIRVAFYIFIGILVLQVLLLWRSRRVIAALQGFSRRFLGGRFEESIEHGVVAFVDGFRLLRRPGLVVVSFALAVVQWSAIAATFWVGLAAFDLAAVAGWEGAFFVNAVSALGVAVPSSPGFVGTFQAFVVKGLAPFGIGPTQAFTFSVGYHAANYLSVTAVGLVYFFRAGLSWEDLEHSEEELERDLEEEFDEELAPEVSGG